MGPPNRPEVASRRVHPDPAIRDGEPYVVLATWIRRGVLDAGALSRLGATMTERFDSDRVEQRSFAPLVLAWIVAAGHLERAWVDAFSRWYAAETDLRGWDDDLGWLHAAAHGADLLGTIGAHPEGDPYAMLDLAARRLVAPTDHVFREQEDDRIAQAVGEVLLRTGADDPRALRWLDPVAELLAGGKPGPVPGHVSNTLRTLRALHVLADAGVPTPEARREPIPGADRLRARIIEVLDPV